MNANAGLDEEQSEFFKPMWTGLLGPPWLVALATFAVLVSLRFIAFLSPLPLQELFFVQTVASWLIPFFMLTASGRRQIGLVERGTTTFSMVVSALAGTLCALVFFYLGMLIFGDSPDNWCISVRNYLHFNEMRGLMPPLGIFALYALPAVFLNPIGEEILFRGLLQQTMARRVGRAISILITSLLFGITYLYLHGIYHDASGFHLRVFSAGIAVLLMACVGIVFSLCRSASGSLWAAMAAHASFNLAFLGLSIHKFVR